jgi:hypothetical protein
MRIHLAGKHALELEALDVLVQPVGIGLDLPDRCNIALARCQFQQLAGIGESPRQPLQAADDIFKFGPLPAEILRPVGIVPDAGLF